MFLEQQTAYRDTVLPALQSSQRHIMLALCAAALTYVAEAGAAHDPAAPVTVGALAPTDVALPQYAIIELSRGQVQDRTVRASNNVGDHAGTANFDEPPGLKPVIWDPYGRLRLLALPPGFTAAEVWAINDLGEAAGDWGPGGVFWNTAGEPFRMDDLGGRRTEVRGMNNLGQVVGSADLPTINGSHAFVWSLETGMIDLGDLSPTEEYASVAYDINDDGVIVGSSVAANGLGDKPVAWVGGQIRQLPELPIDGARDYARSINEAGVIIGSAGDPATYQRGIAIWPSINESPLILPDPFPRDEVRPIAINNHNIVLGEGPTNRSSALLWYDWEKQPLRLFDLLPWGHRWKLFSSDALNDFNQVSGLAAYNGRSSAFLATPVYPTITMSKVVPGRAGEMNTITLSNLTPNATVQVLVGTHGGGTIIPGCSMLQNVLQIDNPKLVATAVADSNGIATVSGLIPTFRRWQTLVFQAVVRDTCEISNLVVQTIQ